MKTKPARGICERCGVAVIGARADASAWAHCVCVGCLPPPLPLPIGSFGDRNQADPVVSVGLTVNR